jgi:hypothetical protein
MLPLACMSSRVDIFVYSLYGQHSNMHCEPAYNHFVGHGDLCCVKGLVLVNPFVVSIKHFEDKVDVFINQYNKVILLLSSN